MSVTVPFAFVIVKFFEPAVDAGVVIESEVEVLAPRVAAVPPRVAEVTDDKFVPVITVTVPPVTVPEVTDIEAIVGSGRYV